LYENDKIFLAPFYDLLSTLIYPELSRKMAMKLGTEYSIDKINTESFLKMADEAGLNKRLTVKRVIEVCDLVLKNLEHTGLDFHELAKLQELIHKRAVEIKLDFAS
jgi:serine/threonine-protein kinase HipA